MLDAMADRDRLSVTLVHSRHELLIPATEIAGARAKMRAKIEAIEASGTTDLGGAMAVALDQLGAAQPGELRRLVLLSDGVPNDPAPVYALARTLHRQGVPVTALGLGLDFDEVLLGALANQTGGRFHYVEDPKMVATVFAEEVLRLERIVAKNIHLTLQPGPNVKLSVVGRPVRQNGRQLLLPLGDLAEAEQHDVVVELTYDARRDGARMEMLDALLRFDDAVAGAGRMERTLFLSARSTNDAEAVSQGLRPEISKSAARQAAAGAVLSAMAEARRGRVAEAHAIVGDPRRSRSCRRTARFPPGLSTLTRSSARASRSAAAPNRSTPARCDHPVHQDRRSLDLHLAGRRRDRLDEQSTPPTCWMATSCTATARS